MGIRSVALQMEAGFKRVLGDDSAFLWKFTDEERMMESERANWSLEQRYKKAANARIFVQATKGEETTAWEHLRHLLRTGPLVPVRPVAYDRAVVDALCEINDTAKLAQYYDRVEGKVREEFPKIFVFPCCTDTADAMLSARRSERDESLLALGPYAALLHALAIGALSHRDRQTVIPREEFVARRLDRLQPDADPMVRVNVARKAEHDHRHQARGPRPMHFVRNEKRTVRHAMNKQRPSAWSTESSPGSF
jgi:hypothetical protein